MSSKITFTSPFIIEETKTKDFIVLKACLLAEGMTGNGHFYEIGEMEKIAKQFVGKPVHFGASAEGKHLKTEEKEIGKVLSASLDKTKKKIFGRIKIWNTATFPNIIETVKSFGRGMGVSIGGSGGLIPLLKNGLPQLIKTGHGFISKVVNFILKQVQLIPPNVPRGQKSAKVLSIEEALQIELVPIEETLIVDPEIEISFHFQKGLLRAVVID